MIDLCVMLIGDASRPETLAARHSLDSACVLRQSQDLSEAIQSMAADEPPPDLVVLVQNRPGEHSAALLGRLRRGAPLARWIVITGSWCAAESRSGQPLEGVVRDPWHRWAMRFDQEQRRLETRACPLFGLPLTATDDEHLLTKDHESSCDGSGLIVIRSPHDEMADWLSDACTYLGYATVRLEAGRTVRLAAPGALLWDTREYDDGDARELSQLQEDLPDTPTILLTPLARRDSWRRALESGVACVLAKPLDLRDFWWCLERIRAEEMPTAIARAGNNA